jgi:asparagine synthase (glutamine-hydrolysing)
MCGITGFLDLSHKLSSSQLGAIVDRMTDTLSHRGPDDRGTWVQQTTGTALGHRRLSILDLSKEGHQPMRSACNRYVLVHNGEVYNFLDLRRELEGLGHSFRGSSDTEVILTAICQWGLESAVRRFIGMFAFALWDTHEQSLHLVRDRLGIKPLYYSVPGGWFLFGSELKALHAHPNFKPEIDISALALYFRYNYVPTPHSIYKGTFKLPPGTILTYSARAKGSEPRISSYWSVKNVAEQGVTDPFPGSEEDAAQQLESLLGDAVKLHTVSDVPLGAFLSGGVDSSAVVALMQEQHHGQVKTFTIGFWENRYNEAKDAKAVANHLGTDHTEFYVKAEDALARIPSIPELYDEPFADASQIPTMLLSSLTRHYVTVSLSGDGGDEVFGGYNRYQWIPKIWKNVGWMPQGLRSGLARALTAFSPSAWDSLGECLKPAFPESFGQRIFGDKIHKLAGVLGVESAEKMYLGVLSNWPDPESLVPGASEPLTAATDRGKWAALPTLPQHMMYLDTISYLPDDILTKVDRASMAVGLEARVPLLDHRVVEFSWRLPLAMKLRKGEGRWLLRQVLFKHVPRALIERPKMGFGIPIDAWLRGPLRAWAEELLDEKRLRQEGLLNSQPIRRKWAEHLSGQHNWQYQLWGILMFQAWKEKWGH